jgi:3-deoxy-D-manno-octulosonate 8-phosphate phosphatase (KDO 8-P phosphatase)
VLASGRHSEATLLRAREMRVDEVLEDVSGMGRKLDAFEAMLTKRGIAWDECAFVGDDLADLPLLSRAALSFAVANAVPEVKEASQVVLKHPGGSGVVREVAEALLRARGTWDETIEHYLQERGDVAQRPARSR